jgi:hypothetical protein|tara:strand:+ start:44 stop:298 length:255 start_codon:yes stop_codon:yes gene_type:complete
MGLVGPKTERHGKQGEENKQHIMQDPGSDNQDTGFNRARLPGWLDRRGEIRRHAHGQQGRQPKRPTFLLDQEGLGKVIRWPAPE